MLAAPGAIRFGIDAFPTRGDTPARIGAWGHPYALIDLPVRARILFFTAEATRMFDRRAILASVALCAFATIAPAAEPQPKKPRSYPGLFVEVMEAPDDALSQGEVLGEEWTIEGEPAGPGVSMEGVEDASGESFFHFGEDGMPGDAESWSSRPFSLSWFGGGVALDDPRPGEVEADTGYITGLRAGWDYCAHGGIETRFGLSKTALNYPNIPNAVGDADLFLWDLNWLYYPWECGRVRPFVSAGLGISDIKFLDEFNRRAHETVLGVPVGIGVKVRCTSRLAFRADLQDNIAVEAGEIDTMHNLSFNAGLEWRFGSRAKRSYYPWSPSRAWW